MIASNAMQGPATDALERATKRQRTSRAEPTTGSFDLVALFDAVSSESDFPSIGWFDDDFSTEPASLQMSGKSSKKRSASGLVRSKAFNDLSSLDAEDIATIKTEPKPTYASCSAASSEKPVKPMQFSRHSKSSLFAQTSLRRCQ